MEKQALNPVNIYKDFLVLDSTIIKLTYTEIWQPIFFSVLLLENTHNTKFTILTTFKCTAH